LHRSLRGQGFGVRGAEDSACHRDAPYGLQVDPSPVVAACEHDLVPALLDVEVDATDSWLAGADAFGLRLHPVRQRVAHHVHQGIPHREQDVAIEAVFPAAREKLDP
jgi:hypothetical protein